jgi:hypothetical protein
MYGDIYRLGSRRRMAQATHRHVELRWLWKKLRPAHKTSADFRPHNLKPLRQVCRACTVWCKHLARFAGPLVAIDGSKCKAGNAKERTFPADKLKHLLPQIDQRVEAPLQDLDGQDNAEDAGPPGGAVADNVQAKMEGLQHRKLRYADVPAP